MADVVEREVVHEPMERSSGPNTAIIVLLVIVLLLVFFFLFGGRRLFSGFGGTTISVPRQIDVNVNSGGQGGDSGGTAPAPAQPQGQ